MVPVMELWLPILLSAVAVFILSSVIHMLLGYHNQDFGALPNEDAALDAMRALNAPPGDYIMPYATAADMKNEAMLAKRRRGPIVIMTLMPGGDAKMGRELTLWFLYAVVVAIFAAYIAGRALEPGAHYLEVFRFVGATTFVAYGLGLWQQAIWYKKSLRATVLSNVDALLYAVFSAGIFGWLWP